MTKEELKKELELLADSCDSNYALELNGYNRGVLDALDVVNKYFALAPVSSQVCVCDAKGFAGIKLNGNCGWCDKPRD